AVGCEISFYERVYFPHSLGIFYQAVTQYLGFPHYGDEYKVMGLAAYGRPSFLDIMRKIVRLLPDGGFELDLKFFRYHREDIPYQWMNGSPEFGDLFSPGLEGLLGPRRAPNAQLEERHNDIARSAFDATEIRKVLDAHAFDIASALCTVEDIGDEAGLCRRAAEAIAKGQVIGWFQGRMEWGPRALGNRSILSDVPAIDLA